MATATTSSDDSDLEEMKKKYLKPVETPEKKKLMAKVKKISKKIGEGKKWKKPFKIIRIMNWKWNAFNFLARYQ